MNSVKEAFISIQEAGQAITAVQEAKQMVEERLSVELGARLEFEDALKQSSELLNIASAQRYYNFNLLITKI